MMIIVVIITVVTITTIMTVSIVMVADGCASALGAAFKLSLQCCVGWHCLSSVSYTHLTLPTNREV